MTIVYILLLFTVLFILLEARKLKRKKEWKQLIVASLVLMLALLYGADYAMGGKILPNPNQFLKIIKPLSEALTAFFQVPE